MNNDSPCISETMIDTLRKTDKKTYAILIGSICAIVLSSLIGLYLHEQHQETIRIQNEIRSKESDEFLEYAKKTLKEYEQSTIDYAKSINRAGGPKTDFEKSVIEESRRIKQKRQIEVHRVIWGSCQS